MCLWHLFTISTHPADPLGQVRFGAMSIDSLLTVGLVDMCWMSEGISGCVTTLYA